MTQTNLPINQSIRDTRRQQIQAAWSSDERRARAEAGRRRREVLARMLFDSPEPEIWAVGAPVKDDLRRLAG